MNAVDPTPDPTDDFVVGQAADGTPWPTRPTRPDRIRKWVDQAAGWPVIELKLDEASAEVAGPDYATRWRRNPLADWQATTKEEALRMMRAAVAVARDRARRAGGYRFGGGKSNLLPEMLRDLGDTSTLWVIDLKDGGSDPVQKTLDHIDQAIADAEVLAETIRRERAEGLAHVGTGGSRWRWIVPPRSETELRETFYMPWPGHEPGI